MGRTRDGSVVTWLGRRKGTARPRTTPGTVFDEVDRREV